MTTPTFNTSSRDMLSELEALGPAKWEAKTGFVENWQTAVGQMFDSGLSISRAFLMGGPKTERNQKLQEYVRSGDIKPTEIPTKRPLASLDMRMPDYSALAEVARAKGLKTETDQEIEDSVRAEVKAREKYSADIFRRSSGMGKVGMFAGTMTAGALDPVMLPSYFIGLGAVSKSASVLANVVRVFGAGAAVEAGTQTFVEPFVYRWKNELGQDYNVDDAVKNILFSAVLGGAVPGTAVGLGGYIKHLRKLRTHPAVVAAESTDPAIQAATRILDHAVREAEEGVKRSTPRVDAQGRVWDDVKYQIARQNAEEAGLLDEFLDENPQAPDTAETFYSELEGETANLEGRRPTNSGRPDEPVGEIDEGELEASFRNATKEDLEIAIVEEDIITGEVKALTARSARDVVDELDESTNMLERLINCLTGAAANAS